MNPYNVILIGGQSNGKIVYDYLKRNRYVHLMLTVTYPDHADKPRMVCFPDAPDILKVDSANRYLEKIRSLHPDLLIVAGWSELLEEDLLACSKEGVIGFHPSRLPYDRGRSVLAWQIEEGYTETALTLFYYNSIPDAGDIIAQERIQIAETDYIADVLDKVDFATLNLMRAYFPLLRKQTAPRRRQEIHDGSYRRLRDEGDSRICWDRPAKDIVNKIRAISKPYPGAVGLIQGRKIKIWRGRAVPVLSVPLNTIPANGDRVAELCDGSLLVKCRDGFVQITEYEDV